MRSHTLLDHFEDVRAVENRLAARRQRRTRCRSIIVVVTSSPVSGSSKITTAGSCISAAEMTIFCRMPFE